MAMTRKSRKRLIALGVGIVLLATIGLLAVYAREYQQKRRAQQAYERGIAAFERGDFEAALPDLSFYIGRNRDDAQTMYAFAESRFRVEQPDGGHLPFAERVARQAASLAPDDPRPHELLLKIYPRMGYWVECLDTAKDLLRLDPDDRDALDAAILALIQLERERDIRLDRESEAEETLVLDWLDRHPSDLDVHVLRIELLALQDQLDKAAAEATALQAEFPDDPRPHLALAAMHAQQTDIDSATESLLAAAALPAPDLMTMIRVIEITDRLVATDPENERLTRIANGYLEQGRQSPELGPAARTYAAVRAWKRTGEVPAADTLAAAGEGLEDLPADLIGWLGVLTGIESESGSITEAAMSELGARDDPSAESWESVLAARDSLDRNDFTATRTKLDDALRADRQNYAAWFLLARLESALGEWQAADEYLDVITSPGADPLWVQPHFMRAKLLLEHGQVERASQAVREALPYAQADDRVHSSLYLIWVDTLLAKASTGVDVANELDVAKTTLEQTREDNPEATPVLLRLARIYSIENGDAVLGLIDAMVAAETQPDAAFLVDLWSTLWPTNRHAADRALDMAIEIDPEHPAVLYARATRLADSGDVAAAAELLDGTLADLEGDRRLPVLQAAARYFDHRDPARARELAEEIVRTFERSPSSQTSVLQLNAPWSDHEIIDRAIANLRALSGEQSTAWRIARARRLLTFADADSQQDSAAEAADLLRPVLSANPADPAARVLSAQADLALGARDSALSNLAIAADSSGDPQLEIQLIEMLWQAGATDAARGRLEILALASDLSVELQHDRARLLADLGMWPEAIAAYESLARDGAEADRLRLAQLYARRGRLSDAKAVFEAIANDPGSSDTALIATAHHFANEDLERGLALLERGLANQEQSEAERTRASFFQAHGRPDRAREILQERAERQGSADAWEDLAQLSMMQSDQHLARLAVDKGLEIDPEDPMLLAIDAYLRGAESSNQVVADLLRKRARELNSEALEAIATAMEDAEDSDDYIRRLDRITRDYPHAVDAWNFLVDACRRAGRTDQAVQAATRAMQAVPTDSAVARQATTVLIDAGRLEEALVVARQWRDRAAGNPYDADITIASILLELGDPEQAIRTLERWEPWEGSILTRTDTHPHELQILAACLARRRPPRRGARPRLAQSTGRLRLAQTLRDGCQAGAGR